MKEKKTAEAILEEELQELENPYKYEYNRVNVFIEGFEAGFMNAAAQFEQKWIPVTPKTIPEFGTPVLVNCKIYGRYIGWYEYIGEFQGEKFGNWHDGKQLGVLPPTHWMPLPTPPTTKK